MEKMKKKKTILCIISGLGWVKLRLFLHRTLRLGRLEGRSLRLLVQMNIKHNLKICIILGLG